MIHLIVGNTGSGKTTYAQALKAETQAVIFSIDKWNKTLFLDDKTENDGLEWFLERIERAESMIVDLVLQLESVGRDSVLDLGLSKFEHREKFRKFAHENGFEIKLHFLDIPKEIRWERVMQRNQEKGESFEFEVSEENFNFMENWFEKPEGKELEKSVVLIN
ncbi:ATP-binding protein [Ancylomarina euxinus]|uniref:ATP-binding protein n=1 Tax=Ancylomarina euxinus TaxID=2283627 RepID=A0A425Y2X4_9BACT|nr:ATP-binding protein [Ancylomarina euxinus]MCZ4694928.1 ATP-binding protein [Ancylomarina euxinus]MUP14794.1 AAA family ATPase [Ancylomarina euxinus]RRG22138.1 ATP-binding protein [Ancylomarina euxinus]